MSESLTHSVNNMDLRDASASKNKQILTYRQTYRTFLLYIDQDMVLGGMKAERASFLFRTEAYYVVFVFNDIQNSF